MRYFKIHCEKCGFVLNDSAKSMHPSREKIAREMKKGAELLKQPLDISEIKFTQPEIEHYCAICGHRFGSTIIDPVKCPSCGAEGARNLIDMAGNACPKCSKGMLEISWIDIQSV
ncbi:MAG: hypothetical protein PHQ23_12420 [Candidatus Wallbacteria bacterium]|nr:hypothetical protein [Candidatus Wallbacteria bacterium]